MKHHSLDRRLIIFAVAPVLLAALASQAAAQNPPAGQKEALAIVQRCFQCHGQALQASGLDLHTRAGMLKGGAGGPAIVPGNAEASLLFKRVTGAAQPKMPMAPVP